MSILWGIYGIGFIGLLMYDKSMAIEVLPLYVVVLIILFFCEVLD